MQSTIARLSRVQWAKQWGWQMCVPYLGARARLTQRQVQPQRCDGSRRYCHFLGPLPIQGPARYR
jgi:hypothetical protein